MVQSAQPEWTPEVQVTDELAHALIEAQFPGLHPVRARRFAYGMDNVAFLVNDRYVFRFPQRSIAAPLMETERAVLPIIAPRLPLAVPVPEYLGLPHDAYPWSFTGYVSLPGRPADSARLSEAQRARMAAPLGTFLAALHRIDPAPAVARGLPGDTMRRLDHAHRLPLAQSRLAELHDAGLVEPQPFTQWLEQNPPQYGDGARTCIVHGDLYLRHLLVDDRGAITGVIDWGDMHAGDAALDLMIAHTVLPPAAHDTFLTAYGTVDEATWSRAKYRAIYHAVLVAHYGHAIGDRDLTDAARGALENMRASL